MSDLPPIRSTADRATLDDLLEDHGLPATTISDPAWTLPVITTAAARSASVLAEDALATIESRLQDLRRDEDARQRLEAAVDGVIATAVRDATLAGRGTLIAYGPDEVVARPTAAVPAGQVLLIATHRLDVDWPGAPIQFDGANL